MYTVIYVLEWYLLWHFSRDMDLSWSNPRLGMKHECTRIWAAKQREELWVLGNVHWKWSNCFLWRGRQNQVRLIRSRQVRIDPTRCKSRAGWSHANYGRLFWRCRMSVADCLISGCAENITTFRVQAELTGVPLFLSPEHRATSSSWSAKYFSLMERQLLPPYQYFSHSYLTISYTEDCRQATRCPP